MYECPNIGANSKTHIFGHQNKDCIEDIRKYLIICCIMCLLNIVQEQLWFHICEYLYYILSLHHIGNRDELSGCTMIQQDMSNIHH